MDIDGGFIDFDKRLRWVDGSCTFGARLRMADYVVVPTAVPTRGGQGRGRLRGGSRGVHGGAASGGDRGWAAGTGEDGPVRQPNPEHLCPQGREGERQAQNTIIHTYPNVSQFCKHNPEEFLKQPACSRDFPPCTHS